MKKTLSSALILASVSLFACPMQQEMMSSGMGMGLKCDFNTSILPPRLESLGLSDAQKAKIQQIREESKVFHNKQHEKMMEILTPEQQKKFSENSPAMCQNKQMPMTKGVKAQKQTAKMPDHSSH